MRKHEGRPCRYEQDESMIGGPRLAPIQNVSAGFAYHFDREDLKRPGGRGGRFPIGIEWPETFRQMTDLSFAGPIR